MAGQCRNTYIDCDPMSSGRRRRQAADSRIFMTVEGIAETNEYNLTAMTGDFSTPQVNLQCSKRVDDDRQSVIVSCRHDRELVDARCSINNAPPQQCTLPWKFAFTPPTKVYDLQISVTDTLQLNDTAQLEHTVGPLVLDCSLNPQMEIECLSSNQLDLNQTICSFRGNTMDHCILPYKIDVKGWPLGTHIIHMSATDVFGSSAEAAFEYIVSASVPPLEVILTSGSPRVTESSVEAEFVTTRPVTGVRCFLRYENKNDYKDCSSGSVSFTGLNPGRYVLKIFAYNKLTDVAVLKRVVNI